MTSHAKYFLLGFIALASSACEKNNEFAGLGAACDSDADCPATAAICDMTVADPVCVQCVVPGQISACMGNTPVCGMNKTCRACSAHSDCASDACLPDGSCAMETQVVYLKSGSGSSSCSKSSPCNNLDTAIGQASTTRPYVRVIGDIFFTESDVDAKQITLLGEENATLRGQTVGGGPKAILTLKNSAKVAIYDLTLQSSRKEGIKVDTGSSLSLIRSRIVSAAEEGLLIQSGSANVLQSEIVSGGGTARRGILLVNGELTVNQSKISDNGGGVSIGDNQKFTILNSFITNNRNVGGVRALKPGAGSKLEFNTIVDNREMATSGSTDSGGVSCDDSNFTFSKNIIFRNIGGIGGFVQTAGSCKFDGSFVGSNAQAETGSLGFVKDTSPRDYHLTIGSPATVKDVFDCDGVVDFDGDARPQGAKCDLGADELKQ